MAIAVEHPWLVGIVLNSVLFGGSYLLPKPLLTLAGSLHAWALGVLVWGTLGWRGYAVVVFYFLVGSLVTRVGFDRKAAAGIAEKRSGARGPENVWGSAAIAALCALGVAAIAAVNPESPWRGYLVLGYVASFCTKLSDTCASEIGKAYGRRTFSIISLQPVPAGTEGAVSLEGTFAGLVGAIAQGLVALAVGLLSPLGVVWCAIAATVATTAESILGATIQDRYGWLTNELMNVINTAIGAAVAIAIVQVLPL
ncbi:MAG: TIGR00297 family protein [Cyanophyceae cyanobacterium]